MTGEPPDTRGDRDDRDDLRPLERAVPLAMAVLAIVVGWQGLRYLIDPASVVGNVDVRATTVDELHVLRTGYAAGLLGVAAVTVLGAIRAAWRRTGIITMAVAMGALVVARLVSVVVDGRPSDGLVRLLVVEGVLATGAFVLLAIDRRTRSRM